MKHTLRNLLIALLAGSFSIANGQDGEQPSQIGVAVEDSRKARIQQPTDLYKYFEKVEHGEAPLQLGDASDRVRELQASLNRELCNESIYLGESGVYVGNAVGADDPDRATGLLKRKVRIVYSEDRLRAFVVRGNWIPLDSTQQEIKFGDDRSENELALTHWVRMPPEPLKVDGVYGQHTEAAVALFQWQQRLPVSGTVDVVTLDKLEPMVPTSPLLAATMGWVSEARLGPFNLGEDKGEDNYAYWVKTCTSLAMTLLIFLGAAIAFHIARTGARSTRFLSRWLFTPSTSPWFTELREHRVFLNAAHFAPALFIYVAALAIFPASTEEDKKPYLEVFQHWRIYISNLALAYLSLVLMIVSFAIADTFDAVVNPDRETENPIGSIIRAAKRLIGVVGTLMICASLLGRQPFFIIGGLGAFTAVFMLVFRDYLLGLVASVQIIANRVVKVGDWITMPKFNADGDVQEISLSLIKVQNFDKTVSTIPTNSVLTESFRNWTGMRTSGGRRIKRSILIDMRSICVCTQERVERFEKIELIRDYIQEKKGELAEYNRTHDVVASNVNSRRLTNIGTFRAYLEAYLECHPGLTSEMTFLVRHLQPTSNGLPLEIYAFCRETDWGRYEAVQADIFDHLLAVLPEFGLDTFQEITDFESRPDRPLPAGFEASVAELEQLVQLENAELEKNPRRRLATGVQKVNRRIKALRLEDYLDASGNGRAISLRHLQ